jgi:ketosteroid isomerase-like protein
MKAIKLAVAVCCVSILGSAAHAAGEPPALTPFYQFADAMNAGNAAKAASLFTPDAVVVDEFGVHVWKSFGDWDRDWSTMYTAQHASDFNMSAPAPSFKSIDAKYGYGVVPTTLRFKINGKLETEKGLFTFSTAKTPNGWRITSLTWSTL